MVAKYGTKGVVLRILMKYLEYVRADQLEKCQMIKSGIMSF